VFYHVPTHVRTRPDRHETNYFRIYMISHALISDSVSAETAFQPTAAAPASLVPVSQHCRHAYSCSSTAARPPPSPRVSAQPQSLRLAPHIAPHRLQPQQPAPSLKPCNHKPRASRTPHASRPLTPTHTPGDRSACTSHASGTHSPLSCHCRTDSPTPPHASPSSDVLV
jgi:hypothetical protein